MPAKRPPAATKSKAPAPKADAKSVMDCAGGGCGGGGLGLGLGGGGGAWLTAFTPALDRPIIDNPDFPQVWPKHPLMRRIVAIMVDDIMQDKPTLSGEIGELSGCVEWLDARGFWAEAERAMWYARAYGGGGVVCFIDDGRSPEEEVDPLAVRDVVGFYALPKWYLVPDGVGSGRIRAGWYGARIGRPEHYFVTPNTALAEYALRPEGVLKSEMPQDLRRLLNKGGNRFHRSRVIPWPYRDEMDLRLARWMPNWNGWGPGVVESCLAPFLNRRAGALRLGAIMRSVVVNTMEISDIEHRQTQPEIWALLQARLELIKWCRDYMDDSLPIIATDPNNKFSSLTHNVAGIPDLVGEQRRFLLDTLEYVSVRLFGDTAGGLNGGDRNGEWKAWDRTVAAKRKSWAWTSGMFGGGLRQAVCLSMLAQNGPTHGQLDPTVKPTWPSILVEDPDDVASVRLKHAQARAQDALVLQLTPAALRRHDPDVAERYPSLDLDEGPLPEVAPATRGPATPEGTEAAVLPDNPADPPPTATTPGATNEALAAEQAPDDGAEQTDDVATPTEPLALPDEIRTERECAAALGLSVKMFRKWIDEHRITTYPMPSGTRGGHRHSLGEVLRAWQASAVRRADAARAPTYAAMGDVEDLRQALDDLAVADE